jgi:polyphosphate kinase 2 (PPK2 family)
MRAYAEINDFEDQLVSAGAIVLKFWLSVSRTSSWQRFKAGKRGLQALQDHPGRLAQPRKWPAYEPAVCDMIDRTSTENAPGPGRGRQQVLRAGQDPHPGR